MSTPENFLIAEDDTLAKMGYEILIQVNFPGSTYTIVNSMRDLEKMLDKQGSSFTFAIWDIQLVDGNVLKLVTNTMKRFPGLYILVITSSREELFAKQLYEAGVRGYLTKKANADEMINAIKTVLSNNIYMSKHFKKIQESGHHPSRHQENPFAVLSINELAILKHLLTGQRIKEISTETGLKQSTIATYKQRLLEKLHVMNIVELHQLATAHNII